MSHDIHDYDNDLSYIIYRYTVHSIISIDTYWIILNHPGGVLKSSKIAKMGGTNMDTNHFAIDIPSCSLCSFTPIDPPGLALLPQGPQRDLLTLRASWQSSRGSIVIQGDSNGFWISGDVYIYIYSGMLLIQGDSTTPMDVEGSEFLKNVMRHFHGMWMDVLWGEKIWISSTIEEPSKNRDLTRIENQMLRDSCEVVQKWSNLH